MQKNAISSSADPRTRRLLTSRFHLYIEDVYRIQKFWGHMLRHSNPTKNKVWWPRQTKLLVGFGLRFFTGFYAFFDEFLQVLDGFLRVVAKLLHQKPGFVD